MDLTAIIVLSITFQYIVCEPPCDEGYFQQSVVCRQCPRTCTSCLSSNNCLTCKPGFYGPQCQYECSHCINDSCSKDRCIIGCDDGFYKRSNRCAPCKDGCATCSSYKTCETCRSGFYGAPCQYDCSHCFKDSCSKDNCTQGCKNGYFQVADRCKPCRHTCLSCSSFRNCIHCEDGYYGSYCQSKCRGCIPCDKDNGTCFASTELTSIPTALYPVTNRTVTDENTTSETSFSPTTETSPGEETTFETSFSSSTETSPGEETTFETSFSSSTETSRDHDEIDFLTYVIITCGALLFVFVVLVVTIVTFYRRRAAKKASTNNNAIALTHRLDGNTFPAALTYRGLLDIDEHYDNSPSGLNGVIQTKPTQRYDDEEPFYGNIATSKDIQPATMAGEWSKWEDYQNATKYQHDWRHNNPTQPSPSGCVDESIYGNTWGATEYQQGHITHEAQYQPGYMTQESSQSEVRRHHLQTKERNARVNTLTTFAVCATHTTEEQSDIYANVTQETQEGTITCDGFDSEGYFPYGDSF